MMQANIALFLGMSAFSMASMSSDLQAGMSLVQSIDRTSLAAEIPSIYNSVMGRTAQRPAATSTETITVVDAYPTQYTLSYSDIPDASDFDSTTTTVTPIGGHFSSASRTATGSGIASPVVPWAPHPHLEVITKTGFNGTVYTITRVDEGSSYRTVSATNINGTTFMVSGMATSSTVAPSPTAVDTETVIVTVTPSPGGSVPSMAPTTVTEQPIVTALPAPAITAHPVQRQELFQCMNGAVVPYQPSEAELYDYDRMAIPMGLDLRRFEDSPNRMTFDAFPHDPSHYAGNASEIEEWHSRCQRDNLPVHTSIRTLWNMVMPGGYDDDYDRTRTVTVTGGPSKTVLMSGTLQNFDGTMFPVPETRWDTTKTASIVADHSTQWTISSDKGTYGTEKYVVNSSSATPTQIVSVIQLPATTLTDKGAQHSHGFTTKHHGKVTAYAHQDTCEKVIEVVDIGMCGGQRHLIQVNAMTQAPKAQPPLCKKGLPFKKAWKSCHSEWCMYRHQKPMMITTVQSAYVRAGDGPTSHWANITQHYSETLPHWGKTTDKLIYWPFSLTSVLKKTKQHGHKTSVFRTFAAIDSDYSSRTRNSLVASAPRCWDRDTCADQCHHYAFDHGGALVLHWAWLPIVAGIIGLLFMIGCCCCCLPFCRRRYRSRKDKENGADVAESGQAQGQGQGGQSGETVVVTSGGGGGQGGQGAGSGGGGGGQTVVTTTSTDGGKVVEKTSGPTQVVTSGGGGGPQGGATVVTTVEEPVKKKA